MTAPQLSPEWRKARIGRVTGSRAAAILGLSPWQTRDDVMRAMVREAHGAPDEFEGNVATQWGTANEDNAVLDYELATGAKVTLAPFVPFEDWLGASPDRFVGEYGVLEVKCPYGLREAPCPVPFKTAEQQPHYVVQMQIEMFVTKTSWCDFMQWTPNDERIETVQLDLAMLNEILPKLRQFHAEFLHERDHSAEDYLAPKRVTIDTPQSLKMVAEYDELVEAIANAEARRADLLASMVTMAGGKDALFAGKKLTKVEKAGSVSYAKALKAIAPDTNLEPYRGKPSEYWRLS